MPLVSEVETRFFEVGIDAPCDSSAIGRGGCTHVNSRYVIGLIKIIQYGLPVTGEPYGIGHRALPVADLSSVPLIPDGPKVASKGLAVRIHVDPDKTRKGFAAQFR